MAAICKTDRAWSRYLSIFIGAGDRIFVQLALDAAVELLHYRTFHRDRDGAASGKQGDRAARTVIADVGARVQGLTALNGWIRPGTLPPGHPAEVGKDIFCSDSSQIFMHAASRAPYATKCPARRRPR